jgi:hypothetical protein
MREGRYIFKRVTLKRIKLWLNDSMHLGILSLPSHIEEMPDGTGVLSAEAKGQYAYASIMPGGQVMRFGKVIGNRADLVQGWPAEQVASPLLLANPE